MSRRRRLWPVLFGLVALLPEPAGADPVDADLSSHLIAITTGFTGTSVVLFGATDEPGDVIAVVQGPERDATVWRKGKIAGIWANAEAVTFADVPRFYAVAASRPLDDIVPPLEAALHGIGLDHLKLQTRTTIAPDRLPLFSDALFRVEQRAGLFPKEVGRIEFLGAHLFRTIINFPATVPTGPYQVKIFLVRDRRIIGEQTTPLVVSKVGVDAAVSDFARGNALAYGAIAVTVAAVAGWMASLAFRNT